MSKYRPFLDQSYEQIKSSCLANGELWIDEHFPADDSSLSRFKTFDEPLEWKRPFDFCAQPPEFIVNGISVNDLDQGGLGNCWFVSALGAVAKILDYINEVVPKDQTFNQEDYAGIFRFRFWRFGEWLEVCVDDQLPVRQDNTLFFCSNEKDKQELFSALLEKAYAKLYHCYAFLDGGFECDGLVDLTGGVRQSFKIEDPGLRNKSSDNKGSYHAILPREEVFDKLFKCLNQMYSMCGTSIKVGENEQIETEMENGLVKGHAYTILSVYELIYADGEYRLRWPNENIDPGVSSFQLIRMRNPWGKKKSYSGAWSTGSPEWNYVTGELREEMSADNQTDGQFFIDINDFFKYFEELEFVHVNLDAFSTDNGDDNAHNRIAWKSAHFHSAWTSGVNSGGSPNEGDFFFTNPQYFLPFSGAVREVAIVISLLQTESVRKRMENGPNEDAETEEYANFLVFKVTVPNAMRNVTQGIKFGEHELELVFSKATFTPMREITHRIELAPADYVIIPCCFERDIEMQYLLRVMYDSMADKTATIVHIKADRESRRWDENSYEYRAFVDSIQSLGNQKGYDYVYDRGLKRHRSIKNRSKACLIM